MGTVRRTMLSTRQLQRAVPRGYPAAAVDAARQALGDANKVFARDNSSLPVTFEHRGTGGRSSISGITSTVFGATGFLGRYVVNHIAKSGSRMILPARCNENARQHLKVMGDLGQIVNLDYSIRDDDAIKYAVERSNVVVNMVGREWETRNFSFEDVHVDFPARLAEICKQVGTVERLIHVSALGAAEDHPSAYYRSKAIGDTAVKAAFPAATIVSPRS